MSYHRQISLILKELPYYGPLPCKYNTPWIQDKETYIIGYSHNFIIVGEFKATINPLESKVITSLETHFEKTWST